MEHNSTAVARHTNFVDGTLQINLDFYFKEFLHKSEFRIGIHVTIMELNFTSKAGIYEYF